jgi:hypothetical protein
MLHLATLSGRGASGAPDLLVTGLWIRTPGLLYTPQVGSDRLGGHCFSSQTRRGERWARSSGWQRTSQELMTL